MSSFSKQSLLGKEGPFTENYTFWIDAKKNLKINIDDQPDLSAKGTLITAYCRNEHGNFHLGTRNDYNLSLLLNDKRYKNQRNFMKITEDKIIISVTFEMFKKYKNE